MTGFNCSNCNSICGGQGLEDLPCLNSQQPRQLFCVMVGNPFGGHTVSGGGHTMHGPFDEQELSWFIRDVSDQQTNVWQLRDRRGKLSKLPSKPARQPPPGTAGPTNTELAG